MADELVEALDYVSRMLSDFNGNPCTPTAKRHLATLRRHLEPQPIESAPRNGSDVLAFCPIAGAWVIVVFCDGAWVSDTAEHEPTHWLPLPAPANQEGRT